MVLGIIVTVVGIAGVAVWMYHEGYNGNEKERIEKFRKE